MKYRDLITLVEAGERYHGVIEPNSRPRFGQEITLRTPVKAYHATHEALGKVLTNREIKTYDSMGTYLTSNRGMALTMYGPNVEAYMVPAGRYLLARRNQDIWEMVLNNLPIIERTVGQEAADHLAQYPLTGPNTKWMKEVRKAAKQEAERYGEPTEFVSDAFIYQLYRYTSPETVTKYKALRQSEAVYREVSANPDYCREYRALLESVGYRGIIFNGRNWDNSPERQTIFLVFHTEDLHPIREGRLSEAGLAGHTS
jgi:hypothetical protein